MATELSKGKTLVVLAIVIGCFAILWPKIFYPMFQGSVAPPAPQHQPPIRERDPAGHMRPERPPHLHPDAMHPALREKGRVLPPTRTIEKQARPGPMPGMRPPMGGAGHIVSPSPGSGGMGVLMPIYTIGIIVFFLYTMMKIMFKKPPEETQEPRIKDFHMDPDHRKYLFAEEYCSGVPGAIPEMTVKEYALLQEQQRLLLLQQQEQQRRSRSKTPEQFVKKDEELQPIEEHTCVQEEVEVVEQCANSAPATESEREEEVEPEEVAEEIIPRSAKMDTEGKPIEEEEVNQLKRRLEETEKAMERICRQMGNVAEKLSSSGVTELLASHLSDSKETPEVVKCSFDVEKVEVDVVTEAHPPSEQEPELEKVVDDQVLPTNENVLPSDELLADPEQSDTIANMVAEGYSDFFSKTIERLESTDIEFNTSVDEDNAAAMLASDVLLQQSPTLQSALNDMVESIIAESIEDSVAESLTRQVECDTEKESEEDAKVVEPSDSILMQLSDRLQDSGTVLMDVEYQIIPTSDSPSCCAEVDNGEQEQEEIEVGDFERNRELAVMEHMLEQIETPVDPVVNVEEVEAEPSISGFVIREDFPDEDEAEPMTEEEILLARQEIEEIKKLLADVSSGVVHHQDSQMPAMAEDSGTAASKGSSPDMDEYEVIQSTRPTETYECTDEAEDDSTKTSNES